LIAGARNAVIQPAFAEAASRRQVEPGCPDVLGEAGLCDHAAVADQNDMIEAASRKSAAPSDKEMGALFQLLDLGGERHRVASVALEHLNGDGTAIMLSPRELPRLNSGAERS
jgi:hypothetical protein